MIDIEYRILFQSVRGISDQEEDKDSMEDPDDLYTQTLARREVYKTLVLKVVCLY